MFIQIILSSFQLYQNKNIKKRSENLRSLNVIDESSVCSSTYQKTKAVHLLHSSNAVITYFCDAETFTRNKDDK